MTANQLRLMLIPLLATLIMAGFVTTMGLLTADAAAKYGVAVSDIASRFTYFTGGVFLGGIASFYIFDYFGIKPVIIWSYLLTIVLILVLHFYSSYTLLPGVLLAIGALMVTVTCGGVTVITQQWQAKTRQMVMVGQDAMFNGGGIVFSGAATWFVLNHYDWSTVYLIVAGLIVVVLVLAAASSFTPVVVSSDEQEEGATRWNTGIILVGISLLLFMMAKISIFVWAPQFVQQSFDVGAEVSGQFMANIFAAAFVGSIFGTWAASKIEVKHLLYIFVIISAVTVFMFTQTGSLSLMLILAYCYGVSVSATYNAYVAFGLSFVANPTHKNVVYLQLMSGLGSTLAPFISSMIVEKTGAVTGAMQFCFITLLVVAVTLAISGFLHRKF